MQSLVNVLVNTQPVLSYQPRGQNDLINLCSRCIYVHGIYFLWHKSKIGFHFETNTTKKTLNKIALSDELIPAL